MQAAAERHTGATQSVAIADHLAAAGTSHRGQAAAVGRKVKAKHRGQQAAAATDRGTQPESSNRADNNNSQLGVLVWFRGNECEARRCRVQQARKPWLRRTREVHKV